MFKHQINMASVVAPIWFYTGNDRYNRQETFKEFQSPVQTIQIRGINFAGGGGSRNLSGTYSLLINDAIVATAPVETGFTHDFVDVDLSGFDDHTWLKIQVSSTNPLESCPPVFAFLNKNNTMVTDQPALCPITTSTKQLVDTTVNGFADYIWDWLPTSGRAQPQPFVMPVKEHFSEKLYHNNLNRENISINSKVDFHTKNISKNGVINTNNRQAYYWQDLVAKYPRVPCMDGPRGIGTVEFGTSIHHGRRGQFYVVTPWRFIRVDVDGTITTLAGWRHQGDLPRNYMCQMTGNNQTDLGGGLELVGDWSEIELAGGALGFHEAWGMAWDVPTLDIDESAPVIGPPANLVGFEHPHFADRPPSCIIADSQNNRLLKLTFPHDNHGPAVVTIFRDNLNDPWDVVYDQVKDEYLVSVRGDHQILALDRLTGDTKRIVLQGDNYAKVVPDSRFIQRTASLDVIRTQDCVAPEGLFILDRWLYFGSQAANEVRKFHLDTGELVKNVCRPWTGSNAGPAVVPKTHYIKLAVSDGTFFPKGAVFTTSWSLLNGFGFPECYIDGVQVNWKSNTGLYSTRGKGADHWDTLGYQSAVYVGNGCLVCTSSELGLTIITKAQADDPTVNQSKHDKGRRLYNKEYRVLYGAHVLNPHNLPLPWGVDENLDYYMEWATALPKPVIVPDPEPDPEPELTCEEELALLESGIEALQSEIAAKNDLLAAAQAVNESAMEAIVEMQGEIEEKDSQISALQSDIESKESLLEAQAADIAALQAQVIAGADLTELKAAWQLLNSKLG